ncbi:hypothetical protein D3C72_1064210 [compost metagenome]
MIDLLADANDAIGRHFLGQAFLDAENIAADFVIKLHQPGNAAACAIGHHVRQKQRERLLAHQFASTPDGVAEAERHLLARIADGAGNRQHLFQLQYLHGLAGAGQRIDEFRRAVEIVFDGGLVAARDENDVFDTGLHGFVDSILHDRTVDDRQHFLWHRLGGGQKPRAVAGYRNDGFSDSFVQVHRVLLHQGLICPQSPRRFRLRVNFTKSVFSPLYSLRAQRWRPAASSAALQSAFLSAPARQDLGLWSSRRPVPSGS